LIDVGLFFPEDATRAAAPTPLAENRLGRKATFVRPREALGRVYHAVERERPFT
jgi:hypothetical protein